VLLAFCVRQVVCQTVVVLLVVEEIPALLAMAVVDHVQEIVVIPLVLVALDFALPATVAVNYVQILLEVALPLVDALRASILLYV